MEDDPCDSKRCETAVCAAPAAVSAGRVHRDGVARDGEGGTGRTHTTDRSPPGLLFEQRGRLKSGSIGGRRAADGSPTAERISLFNALWRLLTTGVVCTRADRRQIGVPIWVL